MKPFDMRPKAGSSPPVVCCSLGHTEYEEAWHLQQRLQQRLIKNYRAGYPEQLHNLLLLVEHPPTYTLGKSGKREHLLLAEEELDKIGASFFPIGRGGDITYHGPGQLVAYPILDLHLFRTDLTRYVRTLEEMVMRVCAEYGLETHRSDAGTGVWTGEDTDERKICALGIRCSRWVTMHGFAFNLSTDLSYFDHIIPCGIADRGVTSLSREIGIAIDERVVRRRLIHHFSDLFGAETSHFEGEEADNFLASFSNPVV